MDAHKNIFLVKCITGVHFINELTDYCEYNIMFYTENDLIHLRVNEKFSYLNYDKINLKMNIFQNLDINNNKLIIDLYTHYGSSYINILNKNDDSSLNTFYNGHLITNEIVFDNNSHNNSNIYKYNLEVISYDYDYVSISITGNIYEDKDILETRLWFNDYILTTLTKRISKKNIVINHIPKAATDLNIFKTIFFLKYLNCDVNTNLLNIDKSKYYSSVFQDKINNNHLIIFESNLSDLENKIDLEIDLLNIYNNEPVCMIYFSCFLIEEMTSTNLYPLLIKENTDTPIFLSYKQNYIITLEYIILNFNSPIIISFFYEEMAVLNINYRIFNKNTENDENNKFKENYYFFGQNIIIYEDEIKNRCIQKEKNEKILCKLHIEVCKKHYDQYDNQFLAKNILITINVKSNYKKHMSYLNINTLIDGIILGDQFQYYYTNIRQNDSGTIVLNNKKGLGLMYARIINKNTIDEEYKDWNGRIHLLNKEEIEKCNDCLLYDINTNKIIFTEEDTHKCVSVMRCQIIIGVANIEDKNDNANEYDVYEYSIYLLKNNIPKQIYGSIKIQSNKYIQGILSNNNYNNKIILDYFLLQDIEYIKYEIQCKYCSFYLINNNSRIKQEDYKQDNNINKYGSKIIKFEKEGDIKLYYNKTISFEISLNENIQEKYIIFNFKISLIYKGMVENILLLNSEMNPICYKECYYLIPIYEYDKLNSFTMSISDKNLNANLNIELDITIYDSIYYEYIMFTENKYVKDPKLIGVSPESYKLLSTKNYIIFEGNSQYKNMLILGHIKILNDLNTDNIFKNKEGYQVYFTYSKNSRKNYFLFPNRNNLLYIDKNFHSKNIKEILIPKYYLIKDKFTNNYNKEDNSDDSSIIIFSHIKGEGVVELITNNYYIHNNINKLYSELKSFIFDSSHSFFQINYNEKSNFTKKFFINSESGLYTYSTIVANIRQNINEIKLGKANYILHQYDSTPINLYLKINDIIEIQKDITIDIKLEGLDIYKLYNISIIGYFSYSNNLNINLNNIKKYPISKGFYDIITNIGIIKFRADSMKTYYEKNNINLLIINIKDLNNNKNQPIDIMIKATPMPNQLLLNESYEKISELNDNYDFYIPQFEYYFSLIDNSNDDKFNIYKLNILNERHRYMSIELLFLFNNETSFCFHTDISNLSPDNPNFYENDTNTNIFKFIDQRFKNGKRSLILKFEKQINEIFLIVYMKQYKIRSFFSIKYYSFTYEDFEKEKYLYKNRFIINNTNIKINKYNGIYAINWEKIKLVKLKIEKGEIKIDYFLKIINKSNNEINYNMGLFNNYLKDNLSYGIHLINKNEYKSELNKVINIKNNIVIYLIAKFNEINGMENYLIYQPLLLNKIFDENIYNKKNNDDNSIDINNNDTNSKINNGNDDNKNIKRKKNNYFLKAVILILIIIIIFLIILYLFKLIRKIQIKAIYDKYIKDNDKNNNKNLSLFNEMKNESFQSKISFLIEN